MAFPTIPTVGAGRIVTGLQADTSATRTFPSLTGLTKDSGDLLIALVCTATTTASAPILSSWGGGFTEFTDQMTTASSTMGIGAAYKWSDGTETGTFTVTVAGTVSGHAAFILLSIPGADASTPPEAGTIADGTSASANPGSLDPSGWGTEDTLWVAVGSSRMLSTSGTWAGLTVAPANFSSYADTATPDNSISGQTELAVAFRQFNTGSLDIGTFTADLSNATNSALLIAVPPSLVPPAPEIPLETADAVSAATLALTVETGVPLQTSAAVSAATLALTAPTKVVLETAAAASSATITLFTPRIVPLQTADAISSATLTLTAPAKLTLAVGGQSSATLALTAQTRVVLETASAVSAATLALTTQTRVVLATTAAVSSATLTLNAPALLTLAAAATSTATLDLTVPVSGTETEIARVQLGSIETPVEGEQTLRIRARASDGDGYLRVWVYDSDGTTIRGGPTDFTLTASFQTFELNPTGITDYSGIEVAFQGISDTGPLTVEVSWIELEVPESSGAAPAVIPLAPAVATSAGSLWLVTWLPDALSGLETWIDAASLPRVDGDLVASWTDLSGQGLHLTAAGSARPTLRTGVLNGLPVVRFNGTDNVVKASSTGDYKHFLFVAKFRLATFPDYNGLITGVVEVILVGDGGTANWYPTGFGETHRLHGAVVTAPFPAPMAAFTDYGLSHPTGWPGMTLQVGQDRANATRYWDGDVAEVVAYDRVLSTTERQQVENYLQTKWFGVGVPQLNLTASGTSTASLVLTAPALVPLQACAAASSATLALTAKPTVALGTSAALSTASLALTAPARIPLQTSAAVSTATLALTAAARVVLQGSTAVSSATLALTAETRVVLQSSAAVSAATLNLTTSTVPTFVGLAAAAQSAATLALTAPTQVLLQTSPATSSATLVLTAPVRLTLTSAALSNATLALTAATRVTLQGSTAISAATLSLTAPARLLLGTAAAQSAATLAVKAAGTVILQTSAAQSAATIWITTPGSAVINMSPAVAVSTATLALKVLVTKLGGVVVTAAPGATRSVLVTKSAGVVGTASAGGVSGRVISRTGGALSVASAGASKKVVVSKAGGVLATARTSGQGYILLGRTGGALAAGATGGGRTALVARAGGGTAGATSGGTWSAVAESDGGGRATGTAGATRSVLVTKAGGAVAAATGGGARSALLPLRTGGGAATAEAGGIGDRLNAPSGGVAAASAGATSTVEANRTGGGISAAVGGGVLTVDEETTPTTEPPFLAYAVNGTAYANIIDRVALSYIRDASPQATLHDRHAVAHIRRPG